MGRSEPLSRSAYGAFQTVTTRWHDNDLYGHVNNVTYYSWFDTAVNRYLIEAGGLDIHQSAVIAYVVSSSCQYFRGVSYPDPVEVGLRIERLGNRSATYGVGIFRAVDATPLAQGEFVHVFVNRGTSEPVPVPSTIRAALEALPQ